MNLQLASARALHLRREPALFRSETSERLPWLDSAVCPRCQAANDAAATACCECGSDLSLGRPSRPVSYYVGFDPEQAAGSRYSLQIIDRELGRNDAPALVGAAGSVRAAAADETQATAHIVAGDEWQAAAPRSARAGAPRSAPSAALVRSSVALAGAALLLAAAAGVRLYMQPPSLAHAWALGPNSQGSTTPAQHQADVPQPAAIVPAIAMPAAAHAAAALPAAAPPAAMPAAALPAAIVSPPDSAGSILALPPAPAAPAPTVEPQKARPAASAARTQPPTQSPTIERQVPAAIVCTEIVAALALCDAPVTGKGHQTGNRSIE